MNRNSASVVLMSGLISLLTVMLSGCANSETSQKSKQPSKAPELQTLRRDADAVLHLPNNVETHAEIQRVFHLVDRLIFDKQPEQALLYLTNALAHAPWRLDYQLICAELLRQAGNSSLASEKAELVLSLAETDLLKAKSSDLLGKKRETGLQAEPIPKSGPTLVILPIGTIETWLIRDVKQRLAQATGFQIVYHPLGVKLGEPARNHVRDYADRLRLQLLKNMTRAQVDSKLSEMSLKPEDFKNDERVFDLARYLLTREATKEGVIRWQAELEQLKRLSLQWNADELLNAAREKSQPLARPKLGWLAITSADLFTGNTRYVFALSSPQENTSVMSYLRFTSAVVDQPPNSSRLAERTFKQALSSAGFAFGIPRCDSPRCARSYANSLEEHDAKGSTLCAACAKGFEQLRQ